LRCQFITHQDPEGLMTSSPLTSSPNTRSTTTTASTPATIPPPPGVLRRLRDVGITGIAVAVALSVAGWVMVMQEGNNGSVAAAIGMLFMTAPVVLARRQPILAVSIVAVAAVVNGLLWDDIVRCGVALPGLLYITFAVGSRTRDGGRGWGWPLLGLGIAFGAMVAQRIWDPVLNNEALIFGCSLILVAFLAGLGWAAIEPRLRRGRD
jgi:hypothetical protein